MDVCVTATVVQFFTHAAVLANFVCHNRTDVTKCLSRLESNLLVCGVLTITYLNGIQRLHVVVCFVHRCRYVPIMFSSHVIDITTLSSNLK